MVPLQFLPPAYGCAHAHAPALRATAPLPARAHLRATRRRTTAALPCQVLLHAHCHHTAPAHAHACAALPHTIAYLHAHHGLPASSCLLLIVHMVDCLCYYLLVVTLITFILHTLVRTLGCYARLFTFHVVHTHTVCTPHYGSAHAHARTFTHTTRTMTHTVTHTGCAHRTVGYARLRTVYRFYTCPHRCPHTTHARLPLGHTHLGSRARGYAARALRCTHTHTPPAHHRCHHAVAHHTALRAAHALHSRTRRTHARCTHAHAHRCIQLTPLRTTLHLYAHAPLPHAHTRAARCHTFGYALHAPPRTRVYTRTLRTPRTCVPTRTPPAHHCARCTLLHRAARARTRTRAAHVTHCAHRARTHAVHLRGCRARARAPAFTVTCTHRTHH